jgi:hypothetical protein
MLLLSFSENIITSLLFDGVTTKDLKFTAKNIESERQRRTLNQFCIKTAPNAVSKYAA